MSTYPTPLEDLSIPDSDQEPSPGCPCVAPGGVRAAMAADIDRYVFMAETDTGSGPGSRMARLRAWSFYPGLYGVLAYRLAHAATTARLPEALGLVLRTAALALQHALQPRTGVEISARAHIGPGLFVNHAQGVVLGQISAGDYLTCSHNVTVGQGTGGKGSRRTCPTLGDRVWLGVNSVVTGPVELGDDAMVGANAVVTRDVAPRGVVVGVPARELSRDGSFANVLYRGMHEDAARAAAIAG
ncbi:serine O-acetyltransferase [Lapillicoccus jejuensis]|uniref:Serine O-acetyltransferase n=1 Tax=Lapillicoccus jejuensis TaxID=402171 RepID=A0A542E037_9MICO|nr:DapH/DapD/GlmU-related protein [Lapillicoccus jejuensis]TQJ08693.1 serine O-acetyltransferase [Lapillicoccus jejuensis]